MWDLFDFEGAYREWAYFSYTQDLAADHTRWIKRYLSVNPYFELHDISPAETMVDCVNQRGQRLVVRPQGIFSFKRGKHPHGIILDDPLRDPQTVLDTTQIEKVTTVFREEIIPMPQEGGQLHLLGTSQDPTDLFWQAKEMGIFDWAIYPAIEKGQALWPEGFPLDKLEWYRKGQGAKAFEKEFLLIPVRRTEGYCKREQIEAIINHGLKNRIYVKTSNEVYAGLDIGKKRHPSHLAVFMDYQGKLKQIHSHWFDGIDYTEQIEYCRKVIHDLQIDELCYDATRGEFDAMEEQGILPDEMTGVIFTHKKNWQMAEGFDREVTNGRIELMADDRQTRSILSVDNNLKAPETPEGHGDAFWSVCLAVEAARGGVKVEMFDVGE